MSVLDNPSLTVLQILCTKCSIAIICVTFLSPKNSTVRKSIACMIALTQFAPASDCGLFGLVKLAFVALSLGLFEWMVPGLHIFIFVVVMYIGIVL